KESKIILDTKKASSSKEKSRDNANEKTDTGNKASQGNEQAKSEIYSSDLFTFEEEMNGYRNSKENFDRKLSKFADYVKSLKPNWKEVIGVGKGDKTIGNKIVILLKKSNLNKEQMDLIAKVLDEHDKYAISSLYNYIFEIVNTSTSLYGVNPKGEIIEKIKPPAKIIQVVDDKERIKIENKEINNVNEDSSDSKEQDNAEALAENDGENSEFNEEVTEEQISDEKVSQQKFENNEKTAMMEDLVDYIIICEKDGKRFPVAVKAPKNINVSKYERYFCQSGPLF
ncbi:MAG: hypothetical protein NZ903_00865, partial [Candidatus Micrarchaeota archaeon]|nr:hypothetical protein [Candidatus Micrarchaeota archaeon]